MPPAFRLGKPIFNANGKPSFGCDGGGGGTSFTGCFGKVDDVDAEVTEVSVTLPSLSGDCDEVAPLPGVTPTDWSTVASCPTSPWILSPWLLSTCNRRYQDSVAVCERLFQTIDISAGVEIRCGPTGLSCNLLDVWHIFFEIEGDGTDASSPYTLGNKWKITGNKQIGQTLTVPDTYTFTSSDYTYTNNSRTGACYPADSFSGNIVVSIS